MTMQYTLPVTLIPGNSFVHRLNPIAKLVWLVASIAVAFSTTNIIVLYSMAVFALIVGLASGVGPALMKGAAILIPLGSSLLFIQSVAPAVAKPWTPIAELGPFTIYQEGIYTGLVLLGRIATGLIAALVLVMTTHPSDLFTSLGKLKVPYILNFMMAMTLQLIPLFQREVGIIMSAQKSRGMKGSGFSAVLPSFIPVFVGAIERVQQLSISLESRGFGSLGHRTSYRSIRPRPLDWVVGAIGLIGAAVLIVASVSRGMWSLMAVIAFPAPLALTIVIVAGAAFIATLGLALFIGLRK